jgi:hypothetical protein
MMQAMSVFVVIDIDHSDTPIAGVWRSMEAASEHCPPGYVLLKLDLDTDLTEGGVRPAPSPAG